MDKVQGPLLMYCFVAGTVLTVVSAIAASLVLLWKRKKDGDLKTIIIIGFAAGTVTSVTLLALYTLFVFMPPPEQPCSKWVPPSGADQPDWTSWVQAQTTSALCAVGTHATRLEQRWLGRSVIRAALPPWSYS